MCKKSKKKSRRRLWMEKKERKREKSTEKIEILSEDSAREMMMVFDYINKIATSVAWSTRVKFLRRDGLVLFFYSVTRQLPTSSRHTQKNIHRRRLCAAIEVDDDGKQRQSEILISHSCAVALLCLCDDIKISFHFSPLFVIAWD